MSAAKKKAASDKKTVVIRFNVTSAVENEINALADAHGYEDNRSKYLELVACGILTVDRRKIE